MATPESSPQISPQDPARQPNQPGPPRQRGKARVTFHQGALDGLTGFVDTDIGNGRVLIALEGTKGVWIAIDRHAVVQLD